MASLDNQGPDFKSVDALRKWFEGKNREVAKEARLAPQVSVPPALHKLPDVPPELKPILKPETEFQNWAKTVKVTVLEGRPTSVDDVVAIVNFARANSLKVRAVGSTHSFTPIYSDPQQIILYLDDMAIEGTSDKIQFDKDNMEVTFCGGVTVKEARKFMNEKGVYFESHTIIQEVQMLGITPTGSHGTGWDQQSISDWITQMKIVKSDGKVEVVTDKDKLSAAAISLGLFGVIVEQTMKVLPMQKVSVTNDFTKTFEQVFGSNSPYLLDLHKKNFSLEFFWFPFNSMSEIEIKLLLLTGSTVGWNPDKDTVWIRTVDKLGVEQGVSNPGVQASPPEDMPKEKTTEEVRDAIWAEAFKIYKQAEDEAKKSGEDVSSLLKRLVPLLSWVTFNLIIKPLFTLWNSYKIQDIDVAIHFVDPYASPWRVYDLEMAFDCPSDCAAVLQASQTVKDIVLEKAQEGNFPLSSAFEMRFIGKTNCLLSPSVVGENRSGHTAYVEVIPYEFTKDYAAFFTEIAKKWIAIGQSVGSKPIPHWGKGFETIPHYDEYFREVFGVKFDQFKAKRTEMNVDPQNMFATEELKKIFQL